MAVVDGDNDGLEILTSGEHFSGIDADFALLAGYFREPSLSESAKAVRKKN
jgi:hypothetical protein